MKMYMTRSIFNRLCVINIQGLNCTYENINTVLKFFDFGRILLTIDSLKKSSYVLKLLNLLEIEYMRSNIDSNIEEIHAEVSVQMLDIVLNAVIDDNPENIFITNLTEIVDFRKFIDTAPLNILQDGLSDVIVIIARDRQNIYLSFDKNKYDCKKIKKQLYDVLTNNN